MTPPRRQQRPFLPPPGATQNAPTYPCVTTMKKLKHEAELFKGAMLAGVKYAEGRGVVEFDPTDSEGVDKMIYAASLVARIRASANQIQAVAAQLERS